MSRPKDFRKYPAIFMDVLDALKESNEPVEFEWSSLRAARNFRLDFYSYTSAASQDEDMMRVENYGQFLPAIQIQVRDDPPRTILAKKDFGEMAETLKAGLAKHNAKKDNA